MGFDFRRFVLGSIADEHGEGIDLEPDTAPSDGDQHGEPYLQTGPADEEVQPPACSYCGGAEFNTEDQGRGLRATCEACGGTMTSASGYWAPELIGSPHNHPSTQADPASGGVAGAGNVPQRTTREQLRTAMPSRKHTPPDDLHIERHQFEPGDDEHDDLDSINPGWDHYRLRAHLPGAGRVGFLDYSAHPDPDPSAPGIEINNMHVHSDYRSKGIASAMQDHLRALHPEHVVNHGGRSPAGEDWWNQYQDPAPHLDWDHHPDNPWNVRSAFIRRIAADLGAIPVKHAGFHGFVEGQAGHHQKMEAMDAEFFHDDPDYVAPHPDAAPIGHHAALSNFIMNHHDNHELWSSKAHLTDVNLTRPVMATQPYVVQSHLDRYQNNPHDQTAMVHEHGMDSHLGNQHPLFVHHEGQMYAADGHHRIGAALMAGRPHVRGYVYDADQHGWPEGEEHFQVAHPGLQHQARKHAVECDFPHQDSEKARAHAHYNHDDGICVATQARRARQHEHRKKASMDPELRFHFTSAWADVRAKAMRIRAEGGVLIKVSSSDGVGGEVRGDHGTYETVLTYLPGSRKVGSWHCGCKWGEYAFDRAPAYQRFAGRLCSHGLALQLEAQSHHRPVTEAHPSWMRQHRTRHTVESALVEEVYPDGHGLDLTRPPVYAFAVHALSRGADPAQALQVMLDWGMEHTASKALLREALAESPTKDEPDDAPTHAGLVLKAGDTGRILMLQRSLEDEKDPVAGRWEVPGGEIEPQDHNSLHGAMREFGEEVGQPVPPGGTLQHVWRSGPYVGHVMVIPREDDLTLHDGRSIDNPDGDHHEQSAWWDPEHAQKNPALREEMKGAPWKHIREASRGTTATYSSHDALGDFVADPPTLGQSPQQVDSENPGSTGFATSADPDAFNDADARTLRMPDMGTFGMAYSSGADPAPEVAMLHHASHSFDVMYHASPRRNRWGIQESGLSTEHDEGYGSTAEGIYMSPHPPSSTHEDVWKVNTRGLRLHPDSPEQMSEFSDVGGSYYSPESILPERVRLHRPATTHHSSLHDEPEPALPSTDGADDDLWDTQVDPAHQHIPLDRELAQPGEDYRGQMVGEVPESESVNPNSVHASRGPGAPGGSVDDIVARFQATAGAKALGTTSASDTDIAGAARAHLSKTALHFTPSEQHELISEGAAEKVRARNFGDLSLKDTHYAALQEALDAQGDPDDCLII
jgi:8-oxo-dGTP pyrophosphatase MutT (NUDIX family)/GNAT superfamily N-acetyltransferase